MKFGFTSAPVGLSNQTDAEHYHEAIDDCKFGFDLGYDAIWTLEHHFTPYFPTPDLMLYMSHIAAACPGVDLGTCVLVLPWHNPLRLVEQIAMLSLISKGNLILGLGRGTAKYEFDRFNVNMADTRQMFEEAVQILKQGLSDKPFAFNGKHYQFPETLVRPTADADKVLLLGAIGSVESAEVMADLGLPLIHTSNFGDAAAHAIVDGWTTRAKQRGLPTENLETPVMVNPVVVADTDEKAWEIARKYHPNFAGTQRIHYETDADHWKNIAGYQQHSAYFKNLAKIENDPQYLDSFLKMQLIGNPETVIEGIKRLNKQLGANHIIGVHGLYGMDQATRRNSMKMFAEEVIPAFKR